MGCQRPVRRKASVSTPASDDRQDVLRIVAAVELPLVRKGVQALVDEQEDLEVVATIERLEDVVPECERIRPDLVILDTNFHRRDPTLIDQIHASVPGTGVLVLVNHADEE